MKMYNGVAPYTGAWIEIENCFYKSLESTVAPYTGAWIEIGRSQTRESCARSRSLYRSVD